MSHRTGTMALHVVTYWENRMDDELSRILADGYLDGIGALPLEKVRAMRDECQLVETSLSYLRRLAQGRLDIVEVELERRDAGGDPTDLDDLIARLPAVLSDRTRSAGNGHLPQILSPGVIHGVLVEELADMEVEAHIADLPTVSDTWLGTVRSNLVDYDAKVSGLRRNLFAKIDLLQEELGRRYRTGEASVDTLISGE